jgi:hypothetical protein
VLEVLFGVIFFYSVILRMSERIRQRAKEKSECEEKQRNLGKTKFFKI